MRSVDEWIGANDDAMPPPRVRLRIFQRCQGMCHRSGRKIRPGELWALDHIVALCNGGENRETNLAPILVDKHKEKTADDVAEKSRIYGLRLKHVGIKKRKRSMPGGRDTPFRKKINGEVVRR